MRKSALMLALCLNVAWAIGSAQSPADSAEPTEQASPETSTEIGDVLTVDAVLTTGIEDRMPVDTVSSVSADVGEVYCWTRFTGASDSLDATFQWLHGEEEKGRVNLPVNSSNWRTWSSKKIRPDWTGDWEVRILSLDGQILRSISFVVEPATASPPDTTGN